MLISSNDENILIIDSACDQSIVSNSSFVVEHYTGVFYGVDGALPSMKSRKPLEVVNSCITCCTLNDKSKVLLVLNQCLLDSCSNQNESLLQPHQARAYGVVVNDVASRHLATDNKQGLQNLIVDGKILPLDFDGCKCYFSISKPTTDQLNSLPKFILTNTLPYTPQNMVVARNLKLKNLDLINKWRAQLGYPTYSTTSATLNNTTQLVQTLQSETREYMRDYYKTRVWALKPNRLNDVLYSDTFFSSIASIRSYKCFQLFAFKRAKFTTIKLMRRESQAPEAYEDVIRHVGAPNRTVTDNAKVCKSVKWVTINRRFCIETGLTVPHHQHQNYAEREGGVFKFRILKLFHNTPHAPIQYWCYAAEFLDQVGTYLSSTALQGRTPREKLLGHTPDISIFRFSWFQPVWYYSPTLSFPKDKMEPGFFLKLADNTGDSFAYEILPARSYEDIPLRKNPTVLVRCIVREREYGDDKAPLYRKEDVKIDIYNSGGKSVPDPEFDEMDLTYSSPTKTIMDKVPNPPLKKRVRFKEPPSTSDPVKSSSLADLELDLPKFVSSASTGMDIASDIDSNPIEENQMLPELGEPLTNTPVIGTSSERQRIVTPDSEDEECMGVDVNEADNDSLITDLNTQLDLAEEDDTDPKVDSIISHRYLEGVLEANVCFNDGITSWVNMDVVKNENPKLVADYVMSTDLGMVSNGIWRRWARAFLRSIRLAIRRLRKTHIFGFGSSTHEPFPSALSHDGVKYARRAATTASKKPKAKKHKTFKHGLEVPRTWKDIIRIDAEAGNRRWQEAVEQEVAALVQHGCFDFKTPNYKPPSDYQYCRLHFVYDIKSDLRYKARLVCDGSRVDPRGMSTRATVVKTISVRLLDVIASAQNLKVLCGDIGNAFIQATTKEKIYTRLGSEFTSRAGCIALIVKALYGLTTSAERFRTLLADFIRSLGFTPTRYDRDVWLRLRDDKDGYDYICTHVDDFKIVAREPEKWLQYVQDSFLVKESGPRKYYLGNDYSYHDHLGLWTFGGATYTKEAIARVERIFGCLAKQSTPLPVTDCHPEVDQSPLLGLDDHRKFQMLLGMLQWLVTICRPDLCNLVSSLNRFGACPRETHLNLAVRGFGYLKQVPDPKIAIDHRPLQFKRTKPNYEVIKPDFLQDYPDAKEEMDPGFPEPFGPVMDTTFMVDSDHAHDLKTRRSLTGILGFVGSTLVLWKSKRQGAIASSTYAAEFAALRMATEEAISLRYMLRCLGCNLPAGKQPTVIFGDNLGTILSASNPEADLSKKHVALSYHIVRESIAAGIAVPYWLKGQWNPADILTKQIPRPGFRTHCDFLFWRPDYHVRDSNNLSEIESKDDN